MEPAPLHVQLDLSPSRTSASGPPTAASGQTCEHHRAVGRAAHARVGDAHHVGDARFSSFGGKRHIADLGHPGIALRAAVLEHHHAVFVDVQRRIVDSLLEILDVLEDDGAARDAASDAAIAADGLITAPSGARLPRSTAMPAVLQQRAVERADHFAVPVGALRGSSPRCVLPFTVSASR